MKMLRLRSTLWLRLLCLSLTLTVAACGTVSKPSVDPSRVCLLIPPPDLTSPTKWMMDYAVVWSDRLKCG